MEAKTPPDSFSAGGNAMANQRKGKRSESQPQGGASGKPTTLSGDSLPRRTLEQAIAVAKILHDAYAGKGASWEQLAQALDLKTTNNNFKYLVWSAQAYGLVIKDEKKEFSLSEVGRKIVAPMYDGEDSEGQSKAVMTPALLSKFFTDYNGHPLPGAAHFPNVLESKYDVPRDRAEEAIETITKNGEFAGILEHPSDGASPIVRISGVAQASGARAESVSQSASDQGLPASPVNQDQHDWSKTCFYITPIGEEGSEARKHADMMLKHLLEPVLATAKFRVVRADKIERAGIITQQVLEYLVKSRLCVADLSFGNPNVFYELGVRHMTKLPTIQVVRKVDKIPFDVSQGRTITLDTSDVYTIMDRFDSGRRELAEHVKSCASSADAGPEGNPVAVYLPELVVKLPN